MSLKESIVRGIGHLSYKVQTNSPTILIVAGAVGIVTATVLACRATIKAKEIVEESKKDLDMIHDCEANKTLEESGEYTKEDAKRDKVTVAVKTGAKLLKSYILPVIIFVLSFWAIFASHGIMIRRNTAIAAAYTGLATTFNNYRKNVVEKFGEGVDKELRYGLKAVDVEEEVEKEDGTKEVKKVNKVVATGLEYSDYSRFFDKDSTYWTKDAEYNRTFLEETKAWLNKELIKRAGKPLYLNEVYDALDIERTDAGQVVGWRYLPNDKSHRGDNYISFGLPSDNEGIATSEAMRRFWNGLEPTVLLDFNVDGEVYQTMPRKSVAKAKAHVYGH